MRPFLSSHRLPPVTKQAREGSQWNQVISELLRSLQSRAEDASALKGLSECRTGKAKLTAEKTVAEIEAKEEWRLCREDSLLSGIAALRFENGIERR